MSHPTAHATTPGAFNELDPHGASGHGQHSSHVIVGPLTLRVVLAILLVFTVLTVGQAQLELYLQDLLQMKFPLWVNASVVLVIATIKGLLVMAYFMQLRYDNPMNTIVMLFCFFALGLFFMFTGLDLFNRGTVYADKQPQIISGGMWTGNKPIAETARENAIAKWGPEEFNRIRGVIMAHKHHGSAPTDTTSSNRSRNKSGYTDALDTTPPPAAEGGHGAPKSGH
jgi:caa(3)-type oxidase subunit IV